MTDYTDLQEAAEYAAQDTIKFADEDEEMRALQQFHEEVDPETVLALIAENESARKHWQNESNNVQVLVAEVARLNAENERLRADLDGEMDQARDFNIEHAELQSERDHLKAENESLRRQAETAQRGAGQLKEENEALRSVMACVVSEIPNHTSRNGNAPGHCHAIPGVWDQGNGAKSGTECAWCKVWNAAVAMSKGQPVSCGSEQGKTPTEKPIPERSACRSENP